MHGTDDNSIQNNFSVANVSDHPNSLCIFNSEFSYLFLRSSLACIAVALLVSIPRSNKKWYWVYLHIRNMVFCFVDGNKLASYTIYNMRLKYNWANVALLLGNLLRITGVMLCSYVYFYVDFNRLRWFSVSSYAHITWLLEPNCLEGLKLNKSR